MPKILFRFFSLYRLTAIVALCTVASPAAAYIGPGLGVGAIATVLGVFGSIFLLIVAVFYYPLKRVLKRRKTQSPSPASADSEKS